MGGRPTVATLTVTSEEPPPHTAGPGRSGIDWKAIGTELKKAKGKWATFGPWRGSSAAGSYARKIADGKTQLDAALYDLEARPHQFDDGVIGSILWIRYVGV